MNQFSFVHTADLHLDSKFKGISAIDETVGGILTDATFKSFTTIIDYCIDQKIDFLVISGDIYDAEDRSLRSQLKFIEGMRKLEKHNIQVYIVHGNHDPIKGWSANLDFPQNIHVFSGKRVEQFIFKKNERELAQIYGISFNTKEVTTNVSNDFPYLENKTELFTLGLLHCNVGGNTDHENYAPCTISDLIKHNFNYWALGHIHAKRILNQDPMIVYPGNPQGLNPKETDQRGFIHISVEEDNHIEHKFVPSDSFRWFIKEVSIQPFSKEQDLINSLYDLVDKVRLKAEDRPAICRIILKDRGVLFPSLQKPEFLEDIISEMRQNEKDGSNFVWIESIKDNSSIGIDRNRIKNQSNFFGDLVKLYDLIKKDEKSRDALLEELDVLFSSPGGRKSLKPINREELTDLIDKAESFCLNQLPVGFSEEDFHEERI